MERQESVCSEAKRHKNKSEEVSPLQRVSSLRSTISQIDNKNQSFMSQFLVVPSRVQILMNVHGQISYELTFNQSNEINLNHTL